MNLIYRPKVWLRLTSNSLVFDNVRSISYFFNFGDEPEHIKKKRAEALRQAYVNEKKRVLNDPKSWYNKIKGISIPEFRHMPREFQKKYVDMSKIYMTYFEEEHIFQRDTDPRYQEHRRLVKLITNKEREEAEYLQSLRVDDPSSPNLINKDFNKVQPRNLNITNYNFEQYKGFTRIYNEQMKKDREKQYQTKRILKYINEHPNLAISKSWKRKLLYGEGAENVDISNMVDQSISIEGFKLPTSKRYRRKIIKNRTSRDITDYDAWRCMDRTLYVPCVYKTPTTKIILSPTQLIHCFGDPIWYSANKWSGFYIFEDNNLDLFIIAEPNITTFGRGENKDDRYYEEQKKKIKIQKRDKKWPSPEEFWETDAQHEFFVYASAYAAFRKFKVFLRQDIQKKLKEPSFTERMNRKYGHNFNGFEEFGKDYDKYNERGIDQVAVFKYSWVDYLTPDEKKVMKNEIPELPQPAKFVEMKHVIK